MPASQLAILEFYRRSYARLDARARALLSEYARAESEILALILAGLASERIRSLRERRRQVAFARLILRAVHAHAEERIPVIINQSFQLGQGIAERSTDIELKSLSRTNREAMILLTDNLVNDLGDASAMVGRKVDDIFRKEALRSALENTPGERPEGFVSDELQRTLRREGVTAFVDRIGRQWTLQNYTEMAVKTVTNEGINVSQANIFADRGVDLIEINRSKNPCIECLEFNGQTFSLTGRATGYTVLERRPPFHGRCEHFMFASPLAMKERRESGWEERHEKEREAELAA